MKETASERVDRLLSVIALEVVEIGQEHDRAQALESTELVAVYGLRTRLSRIISAATEALDVVNHAKQQTK